MSTKKEEIIQYIVLGVVVIVSYTFGIASVETSVMSAVARDKPLKLVIYQEDINVSIKND